MAIAMLQTCSKTVFVILSFAGITCAAYNYYYNEKEKKKKQRKEIHDVIMFEYGVGELKKSKYSRCTITKSMDRILYYLSQPRHNIDICMYVLTNMDLTNAILKLCLRGVNVRIIVDADMAYSTGSTMRRLQKQGIPVRWKKSTNLMHHKYCLIDTLAGDNATPFVMLGSLNWTNQALCGNWEDVAVTSQTELVRQYKEAFERLWVDFKPIVPLIL